MLIFVYFNLLSLANFVIGLDFSFSLSNSVACSLVASEEEDESSRSLGSTCSLSLASFNFLYSASELIESDSFSDVFKKLSLESYDLLLLFFTSLSSGIERLFYKFNSSIGS